MPRKGNMKPERRMEGRKKKKDICMRLQLVARQGREGEADAEVGGDEGKGGEQQQWHAAVPPEY